MNSDLSGIRKLVAQAVKDLKQAFFTFGLVMIRLREQGYSWEAAREKIHEWHPDVRNQTGLSLSASWLRAAHDTALAFSVDGGISSPDGKHRLTQEEFSELPLSDSQRARLTDLIGASMGAPKGLPKLRISDVKRAVNAKPEDKASAMGQLLRHADQVEQAITAVVTDDPATLARIEVERLEALVAKRELALIEARKQLQAAQAQLAELAPEPTSTITEEQPAPRRRRNRAASQAIQASA